MAHMIWGMSPRYNPYDMAHMILVISHISNDILSYYAIVILFGGNDLEQKDSVRVTVGLVDIMTKLWCHNGKVHPLNINEIPNWIKREFLYSGIKTSFFNIVDSTKKLRKITKNEIFRIHRAYIYDVSNFVAQNICIQHK